MLYRVARRVDPPRIKVYRLPPDSSSAVAHGTAAGHISKTTHANPSIPRTSSTPLLSALLMAIGLASGVYAKPLPHTTVEWFAR